MKKFQMFIGGEATAAADGKSEKISSPATEEVLAEVPVGGAEDVERAVTAAHDAFEGWFDRTPGERAGMLLEARRPDRGARRRARPPRGRERRQAALARQERDPFPGR